VATRVNEEEKKIKAVKTGSEEDFVNWNSCYAWISINNSYSYQILSSNWNWKISRVLWMADIRILIDRFLISKETVVLRRWERSKQKFGCIKQVDKDWTTTVEDLESRRLERQPFIRANNEGPTLGTSALQILHGGNSTYINRYRVTRRAQRKKMSDTKVLPTSQTGLNRIFPFYSAYKRGGCPLDKLYFTLHYTGTPNLNRAHGRPVICRLPMQGREEKVYPRPCVKYEKGIFLPKINY